MNANELGELLVRADRRISVAESMTAGGLAVALVDTPGSGEWFVGGVVTYESETKHALLDVTRGPVITARAAQEMALGACRMFGTEVGIATTGCAGPDAMEDQPVGTVWIGVAIDGVAYAAHGCFGGEPAAIRQAAIEAALTEATREMRRAGVVEPIPDM